MAGILDSIDRLDNRFPPTWEGVSPELGDPFVDPDTFVRFIQGNELFHYSIDQRAQGDLIRRDLVLLGNQRKMLEYLSLKPPVQVNAPPIVVPGTGTVRAATINVPAGFVAAIVTCQIVVDRLYSDLSPLSSYSLTVVNRSTSAVSFSTTVASPIPWVGTSTALNSSTMIPAGSHDVRFVNPAVAGAMMSGTLIAALVPAP